MSKKTDPHSDFYASQLAEERRQRLDEFARAALTGLLANERAGSVYDQDGPGIFEKYSRSAYAFAEAMLAESERRTAK